MEKWEKLYKVGAFKITTKRPSKIAVDILPRIPFQSKVLDLGCGSGRNSIFFAHKGLRVDAVDIVNLNFVESVPLKWSKNIYFKQASVVNKGFPKEYYQAILMARLIQYIPPDDLDNLFSDMSKCLASKGLIGISYVASGGSLEFKKYGIAKYFHSIEFVKELLEKHGFEIISLEEGSNITTHVLHPSPAGTYDIIARKPRG